MYRQYDAETSRLLNEKEYTGKQKWRKKSRVGAFVIKPWPSFELHFPLLWLKYSITATSRFSLLNGVIQTEDMMLRIMRAGCIANFLLTIFLAVRTSYRCSYLSSISWYPASNGLLALAWQIFQVTRLFLNVPTF